MAEKCNHDMGWCSAERQTVFIDDKGKVHIGFNKKRDGHQILVECNKRCDSIRYAYFNDDGSFNKFGKIRQDDT